MEILHDFLDVGEPDLRLGLQVILTKVGGHLDP
jgi:hypothetical protein